MTFTPAPAKRFAATLSIALACALHLGSCVRAPDLSPVSAPTSSRRRPPPQPERCADEPVPVAAPVCG